MPRGRKRSAPKDARKPGYALAQEAQALGEELIPKYHPHLQNCRVEYVFNEGAMKTKGKELLARAKKKSGLDAFLFAPPTEDEPKPFFVIEINKPAWDALNKKQKRALVDHELCHCLWDVEKGLYMRTHDVEEFSEIIKRHGLWQPDVQLFAEIAVKHVKQLELPIPETKEPVKVIKAENGQTEELRGSKEPDAPRPADLPSIKDHVAKKRKREPLAAAQ
jgi:hypothetical protein